MPPQIGAPVLFVCDDAERWADLFAGETPDPGDEPHRYRWGRDAWIVMTYLYLRRAGFNVGFARTPSKEAINVVHYNDVGARMLVEGHYIVCAQADKPSTSLTPWRVVVNRAAVRNSRDVALPHWPQPGLIPRNRARGNRLEVVAYIGHGPELHYSFYTRGFHDCLRGLGIVWRQPIDHHDFSGIDAVIAVRSGDRQWKANKPASKLINAWLAGVPAIVSREAAYVEANRHPREYLLADDADGALTALAMLKADPNLYDAMLRAGQRRVAEFTVEKVRDRWTDFLRYQVVPDFRDWQRSAAGRNRGVRLASVLCHLGPHRWRKRGLEAYIGQRGREHGAQIRSLIAAMPNAPELGDSSPR